MENEKLTRAEGYILLRKLILWIKLSGVPEKLLHLDINICLLWRLKTGESRRMHTVGKIEY